MSLQENTSPAHRPSNFKAKQRWGEKVYVVRWGRGREARPKMPESTYILLKIRFSDHFLMNFWSLIRNIFWKIKNLKAILLQINYKMIFCFNISVSIIFHTISITQTNLINTLKVVKLKFLSFLKLLILNKYKWGLLVVPTKLMCLLHLFNFLWKTHLLLIINLSMRSFLNSRSVVC